MNWIIEKTKGVVYDGKTNILRTEAGDEIAAVFINGDGHLEISLMMSTDFTSDHGWGAVGWDGCENNVASSVWLHDGGGVLEYQENRHSIFHKPGEKISIKIVPMQGDIITPYQKIPNKNRFLYSISEFKRLFNLSIGRKVKTV